MIKYLNDFRGADKDKNNQLFEDMKARILNNVPTNQMVKAKNEKLPNASILIDNDLHVLLYPQNGRNMVIGSRIYKILIFMSNGYKIHFHIEDISRAETVKKPISIFVNLGANIFWSKNKQETYLIELKDELKFFFNTSKKNTPFVLNKNTIITDTGDIKNVAYALLVIVYGHSQKHDWSIYLTNDKWDSFKKFIIPLINSINNTNSIDNFDILQNIGFNKPNINYKEDLNKIIFDNKNNTHHNKDTQKISIQRESNLYLEHNQIVNLIIEYYKTNGHIFKTEMMNIDILCYKDGKYVINEIKNKPTRDNIFKGVGQLLYYRKKFIERYKIKKGDIILVFASATPLEQKYITFFNDQKIKYIDSQKI